MSENLHIIDYHNKKLFWGWVKQLNNYDVQKYIKLNFILLSAARLVSSKWAQAL